ncbi:MAG: hypothetical protein KAG89_01035 [Fulvimarina manganoxydans]|uniref:hypothetical protein n=1 Tax=Fulvimarina manganoxydans TaxID=937218 RepID=UPI002352C7FF|nr:hypothetical protein [Fulvimarina manganoxydans]MCK5930732.1 hypothetical protein [Fulvimarina manganoxydans]
MTPSTLLVAGLSGLASALLFAGLALQSGSAVGLALAAPLPIAIAGLGWGRTAGYIAAIVGPLVIFLITQNVPSAFTLAIALTLPIAVAAHLGARASVTESTAETPHSPHDVPLSEPAIRWFPVSRILFVLTVAAAVACVLLGWMLAYDPQEILPALTASLTEGANDLDPAARVQLENMAGLIVALVPLIQPAVLTLVLVICLYLGARIARSSGKFPRPQDDLPQVANLPQGALLIFVVSLIGTFIPGAAHLVATVFTGAFGITFALVGLARLHRRTRGRPARGLVLFTVYATILLLTFPLLVFVVMGIVETWRRGEALTRPGPR